MAKYQKYAEYKDSGVEWLEEIPRHWNVVNLGYLFDITSSKRVFEDQWKSEGVPFYRAREIVRLKKDQDYQNDLFISNILYVELRKTYGVPQIGDILVTAVGTLGVTYIVENQKEFYFKDGNLIWLKTSNKCDSTFINYCYESFVIKYQMYRDNMGATVGTYTIENAKKNKIFMPPWDEQLAITRFLNDQTQVIDTLIAKQEKLIELLKEKRQAVISHAVTKGLNPDVTMKDSGVEWLGQVPEHWGVKSYRHASRIYRGKFGHRPRNDPAFYDGDYPFIQTGDVARAGKYITSYSQTLNEKGKDVSQLFPKGTLMMAIAANIGDLAILGFEAYAPDSVVGFKPNQHIDLEFLRYSFMAALPALEQTSTQSTQANLNVERIGAVHGVFPSFEEQREIVNHLDELLDKYNIIEKEMDKAINLLQERRTALISAAVTGKIDVRDWQNPNKNNNQNKMELSA